MYELEIYRGAMCHDNEEWCKIWREIDLSFQIWRILTQAFESLQNLHFKWAPSDQRIYNVWAKEAQTLKSDAKFEEKLTCGLKNDKRNLVNFHKLKLWIAHSAGFFKCLTESLFLRYK